MVLVHWLASGANSSESCSAASYFPLEEQHVVCIVLSHASEELVDVSRFSSLDKVLKVMGWILRFLSNMRNNHPCNLPYLALEELSNAKTKLLFLAQASAYSDEIHRLKVGSVVLIKEDNTPKIKWPLGRVIELHPGRDELVHSVTLKTAKGIVKRSIQCLRDLELV